MMASLQINRKNCISACWNILNRSKIWYGMNNERANFCKIPYCADFAVGKFSGNTDTHSYSFSLLGEF